MSEVRCTILTDSNCDLDKEYYRAHDIEVIAMPFLIDGVEYKDDAEESFPTDEFYKRLKEGADAATSQTHVTDIHAALTQAVAKGLPVVFFCFSSGLSGTYDRAVDVVERFKQANPTAEIHLVDSLLASVAQGYLVYRATELREKGCTAREISDWAHDAIFHVNGYFTLDGLEHLRKGGRIPDVAAFAGAKLDIKPILKITTDGKLAFDRVARGRKKSLKTLADIFKKRYEPYPDTDEQVVMVVDADAREDAAALAEMLLKVEGDIKIVHSQVGPVIGSHVGPGMVAVVFWGHDRRKKNGRVAGAKRTGEEKMEQEEGVS